MSNRQSVGTRVILGLFFASLLAIFGLSGCGSGGEEDVNASASEASALQARSRRPRDVVAPTVPVDLVASAVSSAQIDLAWAASTDNRTVTGYRVRRNGTLLPTLDNVTEYEDTGLTASTAYSYTVEAIDSAGNVSGQSKAAVATTQATSATAPTVSSTSPTNAAIAVAVNSAITVTFSEAMTRSTLNTATFRLATRAGLQIAGTVSTTSNTATFTPSANLPAGTQYTATITTGAKDTAGTAIVANFSWIFTTGGTVDTAPPTVSNTSPANAATGIALNSSVSATFSEAMKTSTLSTASFTLRPTASSTTVTGTVSVSGNTARFTPLVGLAASTQYTATITTAAQDAAGNALVTNFTWTFATAATADSTPPQVIGTYPVSLANGVALNSSISATFSEPMTNSTLTTATFRLAMTSGGAVSGTVSVSGNTLIFKPSTSLAAGTQYTAIVTTAAKDAAGNPLAANFGWAFLTAAIIDATPPAVSSMSPANSATGVALNASVSATFSEAMTNSTLSTASFTLRPTAGGAAVIGTVSVTGNTARFTPTANLAGGTQYTATISTAAKDAAGNALTTNVTWVFTTAQAAPIGTAILNWDAVAVTDLSGYRIYYGTAPGTYSQPLGQGVSVGNVTTYTLTALSSGRRYYFAVTAVDTANNESSYSNEVFKDFP